MTSRVDAGLITVSLTIENTYDDGDEITTHVTDAVIPAPPSANDIGNALDEWSWMYLFPLTGTGRHSGDSWYDVTITACSDPALVGQTCEFGY